MKKTLLTITLFVAALFCVAEASAQMMVHPWQGKRVAYLGDSITDPRPAGETKYWAWLEKWLGIHTFVYGKSGRQWNDIPRQADALYAEHGDSIDAIMILMGTNDYNNGTPIGKWYTEKEEKVMYGHGSEKKLVKRDHRYLNKDDKTYCGRINIALEKLKKMYPTKQIVLLTPTHRQNFHANDKNWQCSEDYENSCGEYLDEYVEATKEAGEVWAVPVIDLGSLCGLYPMLDEHARYFRNPDADRLHPNSEGHKRMAQTLYYQLLTLPVFE